MNAPLSQGVSARGATLEDVPAVVELVNARFRRLLGVEVASPQRLREVWDLPGFDPAHDARLVFDADEQLVGAAYVWDLSGVNVQLICDSAVHPDCAVPGIWDALLSWAEARAREAIPLAPPDAQVAFAHSARENDTALNAALARRGLEVVRHFWRMVIEMEAPPPVPNWPDGIAVRLFDRERDFRNTVIALRDAFQDHWAHVEEPLERELARRRQRIENDPEFDPTLWFLVVDGEEIAACALCHAHDQGDPDAGYVGAIGVRRPWRRRGLGLALLRHAFGEFHRRGTRKVALDVDASSLTGATRLYERAGMRVDRLTHIYAKELRPGRDLSTQTVD